MRHFTYTIKLFRDELHSFNFKAGNSTCLEFTYALDGNPSELHLTQRYVPYRNKNGSYSDEPHSRVKRARLILGK